MKLLICTQVVDLDDPVLGFFHAWIEEFSKHTESVEVICLRSGRHTLPSNVRVHSLGKEAGVGRIRRALRFLQLIVALRSRYDVVFAHMNPEYAIAGAPVWRLLRKETGLWYAHGAVTAKLRIATLVSSLVFTSTTEGYGLKSEKLQIVGQGIDAEIFKPDAETQSARACSLVSVSRVARSKDIATAIGVVETLRARGLRATLTIVGAPQTDADEVYRDELVALTREKGLEEAVTFAGPIVNRDLPAELRKHRFLINAYRNKSLDKVLLEAMATGVIPVSSNVAYCALLADSKNARMPDVPLCIAEGDVAAFAESIVYLDSLDEAARQDIRGALRAIVVEAHGISRLIGRIMSSYRVRV